MLLLCDDHRGAANTILEHVDAFRRFSRHDVVTFNPRSLRSTRGLRLDEFDVVVVHYSLVVISDHYLPRDLHDRIAAYEGLKIQYIQDDYRQVDEISAAIEALGIDVLFTLVPPDEVERVWHALPNVRKVTTLAGYVSDAALRFPVPALEARSIDVGYRGRTLPYWIGTLGQEKAWIAQGFLERAAGTDLRCDIGWKESDRIYGKSWFEWLSSCRATLGSESGASITDFDGSLQRRVEAYVRERPEADFWEVHREILEPYEGNVKMNVISPRIFEAAALRTALVLFEGEYGGVVEPDRHYIPLSKDFSNFDEVVRRLRDVPALEAMAERAYSEIAASGRYSFRAMVEQFDGAVDELARPHASRAPKVGYGLARVNRELQARLHPSWRATRVVPGTAQTPAARTLRALAAARLIAGDARTTGILLRSVVKRTARPALRPLANDLVRLAFLRRAQLGRLNAGEVFVVEGSVRDGEGDLLLTSRPPALAVNAPRRDLGLRPGTVGRIIWDHGELGAWFHYGLSRNQWVAFPVGPDARYSFDALVDAGRALPEIVGAAVEPLLHPPRIGRESLVVRPRGVPLLWHLVRHLDNYGPKAVDVARLVVRDRSVRRYVTAALGNEELRRTTTIGEIVADAVKLALLGRMLDGRLVPGARALARLDAGRVVFTSTKTTDKGDGLADVTLGDVRAIVWDHRAIGPDATDGTGPEFALGADGVQEFKTAGPLLRVQPDLVWSVLGRR